MPILTLLEVHFVMVHFVLCSDIMVLCLVYFLISKPSYVSCPFSVYCVFPLLQFVSLCLSVFSPLFPPSSTHMLLIPISVSLYLSLCFPFTICPFIASVLVSASVWCSCSSDVPSVSSYVFSLSVMCVFFLDFDSCILHFWYELCFWFVLCPFVCTLFSCLGCYFAFVPFCLVFGLSPATKPLHVSLGHIVCPRLIRWKTSGIAPSFKFERMKF